MLVTNPLFRRVDVAGVYTDGIDSLISELGRNCTIVCPGPAVECPNCTYDPSVGASSGKYRTGGPRAFANGLCPVCKGSGRDPLAGADVEVVKQFTIERNIKPYSLPPALLKPLRKDATVAYVKGWAEDMPPLLQMKYLWLDSDLGRTERHEALTAPAYTGSIVAGRYFEMFTQSL